MHDPGSPAPREYPPIPSSLDFCVVGIGGSAGALAALQTFFEAMPADTGMAFVVVVHLSPTHISSLPQLLQLKTTMPVVSIERPMQIEPDHVYVIAPNRVLSLSDDFLHVAELQPNERGAAIDRFFRTLAGAHGQRALAIVLSGAGSDGALGLRAIREHGGVCIVQRPDDAGFDAMPRAAIAGGCADFVLTAAEMPARVAELARTNRELRRPRVTDGSESAAVGDSQSDPLAEATLREILLLLRTRTGHDFRRYKRATLRRRIERRLQVHGVATLAAYLQLLQRDTDEAHALLRDLLIGVTSFFRDPEAFEALRQETIPKLFEQASDDGVRVWVAGCSTGEEAYSIAILLYEYAATLTNAPRLQVFATDIDEVAIDIARAGQYPAAIEADVTARRLRRFFDRDETGQYQIGKEVREKVMFAAHNVLRDPPFSQLSLVSCRNLLIYLEPDAQTTALESFHFGLRPGGTLFLGSSESADTAQEMFRIVDKKHRIYRTRSHAQSPRPMPQLDTGSAPVVPFAAFEAPATQRLRAPRALHQRLAGMYLGATVLADPDGTVLDVSDEAARFLCVTGGAPSKRLVDLVRPELRTESRATTFRALANGVPAHSRSVRIERDERCWLVRVTARPVDADGGARLLLVRFEEVEDESRSPHQAPDASDRTVAQIEDELLRTREQLQITIDQSDASNEELKASNEELQAINEELRAASEELETSKEELQSINEELLTVNNELKIRIEERGKINDDLQNLISATDIATVFVDRTMTIKRFTPTATRLFNLIAADVGRSLLDIRHRLRYESLVADVTEAFQSLRVIEREVVSEDGCWYLARIQPYRTGEDRIDGAVLSFLDVTARRRAEEDVQRLTQSTRDFAIITIDVGGRVNTWNVGAERVFGYTADEMIGQSFSRLFVPEDVANDVPKEAMRTAHAEGRAADERWLVRNDGTRIFCSGILAPFYEDGTLRGYGKILRDVTGAKNVEAERESLLERETVARTEAQSASELKDTFLAMVSHELKNPLNLIQLNAELLSRLPEARRIGAVARAASAIRQAVLSQAQIIDDLLDLSRINTGKLHLQPRRFDLPTAVRTIVAAMHAEAADKGIVLTLQTPDEPLFLEADPVRVEQIVWNLLSNALGFSSSGDRVEVRLDTHDGGVRLEVRDTGSGIDPQMLSGIFELFMQGETVSMRRQGGLGIGLTVVKHLVEAHGGQVEAHSAGAGQGSTFRVWLPERQPPVDASPVSPRGSLAGKRILIVDDDPAGTEVLRHLLEIEGLDAVEANDATDAWAQLQAQRFDALVTDIAMPEFDGYALLARVRADPHLQQLPVIAFTGAGRAVDAKRTREAGFDAHLSKPLQLDDLLRTLRAVLRAG